MRVKSLLIFPINHNKSRFRWVFVQAIQLIANNTAISPIPIGSLIDVRIGLPIGSRSEKGRIRIPKFLLLFATESRYYIVPDRGQGSRRFGVHKYNRETCRADLVI